MIQLINFKNSTTNVVINVRMVVISGSWLVGVLDIALEEILDIFLRCGKCPISCFR